LGEKKYKQRFLIRKGSKLQHIPAGSVAYFLSDVSTTFLIDENNDQYLVDYNLETLEDLLDPREFFRINRKMICSIKAVVQIENYFNGRLLLELTPAFNEEVFVSRQRVKDFREWLDS
jgi:DNA-binding LytR/AlgR family response regulator